MEQEAYPLILDGETTGEVRISHEGGWTVFCVRCAAAPGIVRVSVYGGGKEGYLGVLAPEGDALTLRRRLSRSDLRGFPAPIEYAGRAGQPRGDACAEETEGAAQPEDTPAPAAASEPEETKPAPPPEAAPEPDAAQAAPSLEDVCWYASPDGALVCFDGERNLIALPAGDSRIPDGGGGWPRSIEGRAYVVYRTKDGRLIR